MATIFKNPERRERFFRYAPLVLWIGLILFLSTGQASMSNTSRFIRPLLEFLFPNQPEDVINLYHAYTRKLAHVTVYAALAFLAARAFTNATHAHLRRFWYVFAFLLVAVIASIDETNQSYINSRTGSIYDVLLDIAGGAAMILFFLLVRNILEKRRA